MAHSNVCEAQDQKDEVEERAGSCSSYNLEVLQGLHSQQEVCEATRRHQHHEHLESLQGHERAIWSNTEQSAQIPLESLLACQEKEGSKEEERQEGQGQDEQECRRLVKVHEHDNAATSTVR